MPLQNWPGRVAAAACVLAVAATACSSEPDEVTAGPASPTEALPAPGPGDLEEFCSAVAVLDQTDGTTDPAVVLPAIDSLRQTAPAEIRADVDLFSDTLIANNYPEGTTPSMTAAPFDDLNPASDRLGAYVETNCPPGG